MGFYLLSDLFGLKILERLFLSNGVRHSYCKLLTSFSGHGKSGIHFIAYFTAGQLFSLPSNNNLNVNVERHPITNYNKLLMFLVLYSGIL